MEARPLKPGNRNAMTENQSFSLFSDFDIQLFKAGKHFRLYEKLGSHLVGYGEEEGTYFAVWAPNASYVSVIGNFNGWNAGLHPMQVRWDQSGIWELFIPGIGKGDYYKYFIRSHSGYEAEKGDPYAIHWETPPRTASIVWDRGFRWTDGNYRKKRKEGSALDEPLSVYEVHAGSWRRVSEEGNRMMSYRELAAELPDYCRYMGFTHVEFMPLAEHPFYGSWGYQITGYFAPTSRFGTPQDFKFLINALHKAGIGVILDWVPSHFPVDEHGPGFFDGTHLYEDPDPKKGFHPDWKSLIFNYGRNEVRAFLISNALYWLDQYHIDGLRVDAVASMLYLDYSRKEGEWAPNREGGRENLEAVDFLREFNLAVHTHHPQAFTVAEESTAWPGVTRPVSDGGLGFDLKWMMGWMHDTLDYFRRDPIYRKYHQDQLTFSIHYAFTEKFVLPLSHDEVVYGKGSLIGKMPGDEWQRFGNLRLLFSYLFGHPGAKLLFMGGEFAQQGEWRHDHSLDWHSNQPPYLQGIQLLLKDLNSLYRSQPALYARNYDPDGFEWIDIRDTENSVISWLRKEAKEARGSLLFVANFTPTVLHNYRIGAPERGFYAELFNSDNKKYGGSDVRNDQMLETAPIPWHGHTHSLSLCLPPLGLIVLERLDTDPGY